jgi:hypothetical protein
MIIDTLHKGMQWARTDDLTCRKWLVLLVEVMYSVELIDIPDRLTSSLTEKRVWLDAFNRMSRSRSAVSGMVKRDRGVCGWRVNIYWLPWITLFSRKRALSWTMAETWRGLGLFNWRKRTHLEEILFIHKESSWLEVRLASIQLRVPILWEEYC